MRCLIEKIDQMHSPEVLAEQLAGEPGLTVLRSSLLNCAEARFSFVLARPFLQIHSFGSRCELSWPGGTDTQYGDPWRLLESVIARCEVLDEFDLPFPLGGCFGYWGYELKNFLEPGLPRKAVNDLQLPDCHVGFYDSLVVLDHQLSTTWVIATGLDHTGSRSENRARDGLRFWLERLQRARSNAGRVRCEQRTIAPVALTGGFPVIDPAGAVLERPSIRSNLSREGFVDRVKRVQTYIQAGDIYQVNLSHRLSAVCPWPGEQCFQALNDVSPAPFSAYLKCGPLDVIASSPELFLKMSGGQIRTRPIKGTRPRSADPTEDSQLSYQLQTSAKEMAELVMITDLLRNDLGRVCQFGSIRVPELARLERFAQVQHLVSTVEGSLRDDISDLRALAACFPGGSVTGAPKVRAMEIIDELEPVCRGPYTGALGYIGFNRESQLAMTIRTLLLKEGQCHFQVGAGIVADSDPEAEYDETIAKGMGFVQALRFCSQSHDRLSQRQFCS
jgi:para-aminobenzoate synthetase component I